VIYICTALSHCILIIMCSVSMTYFCKGPMEYKYILILIPRTAFTQIQGKYFFLIYHLKNVGLPQHHTQNELRSVQTLF
jgi:hypothetical protein